MQKPTMTEFKALTTEAAYSLIDSCFDIADHTAEQRDNALSDVATLTTTNADLVTGKQAELDSLRADLEQQRADAIAKVQANLDAANVTISEQAAIIETLGGTALGQKMAKEKEAAEVAARIAERQRQNEEDAAKLAQLTQ